MREETSLRIGGALLIAAAWCSGCAVAHATSAEPAAGCPKNAQGQQTPCAKQSQSKESTTSATSSSKEAVLRTIVVSGYAKGLQNAIALKYKAINITDEISAGSIGQFPNQDMAEALERITGIQVSLDQGLAQYVSVEGLNPDYTNTLYNGRELPSGSGTRAFDFQILSGSLAENVQVYKSPTANLPDAGIAGTINVQSVKPLQYGGERALVSVNGIYNQQGSGGNGVTPNIQGLYTNTFLDHRLGFEVAADLWEQNVDYQQMDTTGVIADSTYTGAGTQYRMYGLGLGDQQGFDKRTSVMSMVQFKVNDDLEVDFDTLDSEFSQAYNWNLGDSYYPAADALGPESTISETVSPTTGVETAWEGTNVFAWLEANRFAYQQKLTSNALSAILTLGPWTINSQASFGQARETTTNMYVDFSTAAPGATFEYNLKQGGPISFGFVNYNPEDASNYNFAGEQGEYNSPTTDQITAVNVDASRPLNWQPVSFLQASKFQMGVRFTNEIFQTRPNGIADTTNGLPNASDPDAYLTLDNNPTFFSSYSGPAQFPTNFLTVNLNKFYAANPLSAFAVANPPVPELTQTTDIIERDGSAYGQVLFNSPDNRMTGNIGMRLVRTEELSGGFVPGPGATLTYQFASATDLVYSSQAIFAREHVYFNALPDLNLTYRVTDDLLARFAAAQMMERPDINLLGQSNVPDAPSGPPQAGVTTPWVGTLNEGNPDLKPYRSNQLNLSLEWYLAPGSMLSGMVFYKHVMDQILTGYFTEKENVNTPGAGSPVTPITFTVGEPINGPSTNITGAEIAWVQPFVFLPGVLRNFGAEMNYTRVWTESEIVEVGQPAQPPTGVSNDTYNLGLYYQTAKFGFHANYNYRSKYLSNEDNYFGDGLYVDGYGQLNLSADYHLSHWLTLNAGITNVTQSAFTEVDRYEVLDDYALSGRQFELGVTAQF